MSLKQSAASGVKWSSISQAARQVMQLTTTIVLARLLAPSDFGIVGMATVVTGFIGIFKDLGTSAAVIRQKNLAENLLHSIFWLNALLGLLSTVLLFTLSPLIAQLYQEPEVNSLLKVLSFNFLIAGLSVSQQAMLERDLEFNTLAKIEISATVIGSIVGVGAAFLGLGAWSLVFQATAVVMVTTVFLWASICWKPKLVVDWKGLKSVSGYSLNLTGFNILNYFIRNADYLLIGRFLGSQALGYYTLAYRIMLYPLQNISGVVGRVIFPIFSQIQNDDVRFRVAYIRVVGAIGLITFPLMMGLWALAEPFVLTVFGLDWQPMIPVLLLLAPVGLLQSIGTTVGVIYQAKGRTDWMLRWGLCAGVLVLAAFAFGLQWGIVGVSGAYAIASVVLVYPNLMIPFQLINLSVRELSQNLWRSSLCSLLMFITILGLKGALPDYLASAWVLGLLVPIGGFTYCLTSWFINREQIKQVLSMAGVTR